MNDKKKLLLIGGLGFIGLNIIDYLSTKYEIHVVSRSKSDIKNPKNKEEYIIHYFDISETIFSKTSFSNLDFDYVIYLSSIVDTSNNDVFFSEMLKVNLLDLNKYIQIFRNSPKLKKFIHIGSIEEYGISNEKFLESSICNPINNYGLTKLFSTNLLNYYAENNGFPSITLRVGSLFGNYQRDNYLIPMIIKSFNKNENVIIQDGRKKRDFLAVKDLVFLIDYIFDEYKVFQSKILNVSYGEGIEINELIRIFEEKMDSKSEVKYKKNDLLSQVMAPSKFLIGNYNFDFSSSKEAILFYSNELVENYAEIYS